MKDKEIRILSTRPLDSALIEKAAFQHIRIDAKSFIEIKKLITSRVAEEIEQLSKIPATVVFTSMNAVEVVVDVLPVNEVMPAWKIYCLGGATFTLVKKYWNYENVVFTAKNAAELAEKIAEDKVAKVTFFCGNMRREELPVLLSQKNVALNELVVYETIETPSAVNVDYDAILFFSPSAVHSFFSANQSPAHTVLFAIGATTANAIKQCSSNRVIVGDFPARDQLVDNAINYFAEKTPANDQ